MTVLLGTLAYLLWMLDYSSRSISSNLRFFDNHKSFYYSIKHTFTSISIIYRNDEYLEDDFESLITSIQRADNSELRNVIQTKFIEKKLSSRLCKLLEKEIYTRTKVENSKYKEYINTLYSELKKHKSGKKYVKWIDKEIISDPTMQGIMDKIVKGIIYTMSSNQIWEK